MCGILCSVRLPGQNTDRTGADAAQESPVCWICGKDKDFEQLCTLLRNRGPDISSETCTTKNGHREAVVVHLVGHVLWTQGSRPEAQPYYDVNNSIPDCYLLFNGDIYDFGDSENNREFATTSSENDGLQLLKLFQKSNGDVGKLLKTVSRLRGPFAFMYYDFKAQKVWFGRDFFGRESLLLSYRDSFSEIVLSSVSSMQHVFEIPTSGIFCFDLVRENIALYPWDTHERSQIMENTAKFADFLLLKEITLTTNCDLKLTCISTCLKPPPLDLASDETLQALMKCSQVPDENADTAVELLSKAEDILEPEITQLLKHLRYSVRLRVNEKPPFCKNCIQTRTVCSHSKVGILFSGGLDSMILAYLTLEILEPGESLDLLNVAFFQDALLGNEKISNGIPDRQTGLQAFQVLEKLFQSRNIRLNFIPVNVSKSRVEEVRKEKISDLIQPLNSVLDDSLGCCLWFATAAEGVESSTRILLLGSGADELLGGYGRHRSAYDKGGWNALIHEMQLELDRISVRNLGRDNRVVSDSGVAPRFPFLDENVIQFLTQDCHIWTKCFPVQAFGNRGLGEKLLLRATAFKLLGRENSHLALFPKRAMQFGSRIAKLENSKEKGGDTCARLVKNLTKL